jgi:N-acyl homoserine lactone hydrolase
LTVKVYVLSGGLLDADRGVIHPGDGSGRRVLLPCYQVLIRSADKAVLVDTGMPEVAAGDPGGLEREYGIETAWIKPLVEPTETLEAQLSSLGLKPGDLELLINTHLHFDHSGQNRLFAGVPIAVQRAELETASEDGYLDVWDAPGLTFRPVEGDWSPLPGVEMLHTPGHTPGHQSMLIRTSDQACLFTFDAVYTEEHWRTRRLGAVKDIGSARASVKKLREMVRREKARLVFGHDMAQWESFGPDTHHPRLILDG